MTHKFGFFRCSAAVIVLFAFLAAGCSSHRPANATVSSQAESLAGSSAASSRVSSEISSEAVSSVVSSKEESALPAQVLDYMNESLKGSKLLTISPKGKVVKTTEYPGQCLSNAQLSPNGRYMLCQTDAESGGEGYDCGYTVIDLQTGKQYPYSERQPGRQSHIILGDNRIGYAWSSPDFTEKPSKPLQLFDMQYSPLKVAFDFDYGNEITIASGAVYHEHYITGIGYNPQKEIYYIIYARDLSYIGLSPGVVSDPFSKTRMGVAIFNKIGGLIDNRLLPKEYTAPYSYNTLTLWDTNPVVLPDGWLVVRSMTEDGSFPLLLVNPADWTVKELDYRGYSSKDGLTGMMLALFMGQTVEDSPQVLLDLADGNITASLQLPSAMHAEGYPNNFNPSGVWWKKGKGYLTGYSWVGDYKEFSGIFRWDGTDSTLIHLFPSGAFNLLGTDSEGNCLVLLYGATPQMVETYDSLINN